MSSKNSSNSKDHKKDNPKAKPRGVPSFFPRTSATKKLSLDHHNDGLEIKGSSSLRDAFLIIVGKPGGDTAVQLTFHHPIGKTPLEKDDWVATPTLEVKNLLQRAEDPFLAEKKKRAEQECFDYAVSRGWLLRASDGFNFWDGQPRSDFKRLQKGLEPDSFLAQVPSALEKIAVEEDIRSRRDKLFEQIESVKSSYETKSGPSWDRSQVAIANLKGLTSSQVMDRIIQNLTRPAEAEARPAVRKSGINVQQAPSVTAAKPIGIPPFSKEDAMKLLKTSKEAQEKRIEEKTKVSLSETRNSGAGSNPSKPPNWGDLVEEDSKASEDTILAAVKDTYEMNEGELRTFAKSLATSVQKSVETLEMMVREKIPDDLQKIFKEIDPDAVFKTALEMSAEDSARGGNEPLPKEQAGD